MSFLLLKSIHVSCAVVSYILFVLRGIWKRNGSPIMQQLWIKVLPHIIDTLLITSAVAMTFIIGQYPFADSWLTAKLFGLLLYITLGLIGLKYGKTRTIRLVAFIAAQFVFFYIVLVAATHNPAPFIR